MIKLLNVKLQVKRNNMKQKRLILMILLIIAAYAIGYFHGHILSQRYYIVPTTDSINNITTDTYKKYL